MADTKTMATTETMSDPKDFTIDVTDLLLSSGLNEDCLVAIFKYLSVTELLKICELEETTFIKLMNDYIVGKKLFDFTVIQSEPNQWSVLKVFEKFGVSMKRIRVEISSHTFNHFLRKVVKYCQPDRLTELEINLNNKENLELDEELLTQARPFLRRLEKFSILCRYTDVAAKKVFDFFKHDLTHLKSLTLQNFSFKPKNWLQILPDELRNIREIRFHGVRLTKSRNQLREFLCKLPNLEVFVYLPSSKHDFSNEFDPEPMAQDLLEHFPNLKGLGCYLGAFGTIDNKVFIDDRLEFLARFRHLSELHLTTGLECHDVQKILQFVPNIKRFSISSIQMSQPPVQCRRIAKTLEQIVDDRRAHGSLNEFVELIVDEIYYREFKAIKNIEKFTILSIKDC